MFIVWLGAVGAWAQFSPGPLSRAHRSLSGPANCTACHVLAAGARKFKCLECHQEIRERLAGKRGLHAALAAAQPQDCAECHSEHNGEEFVPIRWEGRLEDFDHAKTGYRLEGRHASLACSRCHRPEHIAPLERDKILIKDLHRTFLGLSLACRTCHADEHRGQLNADCRRCHGYAGWKPAAGFDHATARFRLAGAHAAVACGKCHVIVPDARPYIKFAGLAFSTCGACHNDPHRGAFAAPCQSCHSLIGWKPARLSSQFDHSTTAFPLEAQARGPRLREVSPQLEF